MDLIAPILFTFAAVTFLAMLPTFTALWQRILHGIALLRAEMLVQATRRNFTRGGQP